MVFEIGRLTQEVKLTRVDVIDKSVCNNRVALHRPGGKTVFADISAWDKTGEFIVAHFKKGDEILFYGEMENKPLALGEVKLDGIVYIKITKVLLTHGNGRVND